MQASLSFRVITYRLLMNFNLFYFINRNRLVPNTSINTNQVLMLRVFFVALLHSSVVLKLKSERLVWHRHTDRLREPINRDILYREAQRNQRGTHQSGFKSVNIKIPRVPFRAQLANVLLFIDSMSDLSFAGRLCFVGFVKYILFHYILHSFSQKLLPKNLIQCIKRRSDNINRTIDLNFQ